MTSVRADTPFPTPTGWVYAGELRPGVMLFAGDGRPTRVVVANVERPTSAYEVKMVMDPITVSGDHDLVLGLPWYGTWIGPQKLIEERNHRLTHPLAAVKRVVLKLPDRADLPLDPWVYGFWRVLHLPDGVLAIPARLIERARDLVTKAGLGITREFRDRDMVYLTSDELAVALEKIGEWPAFHPDYMRTGVEQRRALFAGVIDARGRFMNGVSVETARPVIEATAELAMSLGLRASMPVQGQPRVRMSPHDAVMILRADELNEFLHGPNRPGYRTEVPYMIRRAKEVKPAEFVQVKTVDSSYLIGKAMIPARDY